MTNIKLDALIRRKLAFVSFCYGRASGWQRLARAHSEEVSQLSTELQRRRVGGPAVDVFAGCEAIPGEQRATD